MKYKDRKKHNTQKHISVYCQQVGEIKKRTIGLHKEERS